MKTIKVYALMTRRASPPESAQAVLTTGVAAWHWPRCGASLLLLGGALLLAGCAHVPTQQQRLVSKPNMVFEGAALFSSLNRLVTQFEASSASAIGGQAGSGSCSSCGD